MMERGRRRMRGTSPELTEAARELREEETVAERVLWAELRNRGLGGLRFRRQHAIERFVLDFYCPAARLAVEVDGGAHAGREEHDAARDEALRTLGCETLRFTNREVITTLAAVLDRIREAVAARGALEARSPAPPPRPLAGEGAGG
ncbi:MAG TPA: endonuclease domain-containing protein [Longimicrobiaceae bacterium]|nr:endonuclease domain-containing protein [Longimicrobiaceae bacterium]